MDSSVFGSFSQTSFIDLYHANRSSWHDKCVLYEVYSNPEMKDTLGESFSQIITTSNNIESFNRKTHDSYLFGVTYDSTSNHGIYSMSNVGDDVTSVNNNIEFTETYKERKKTHTYYITIVDGSITFNTTDKNHLYIDQYLSISSMVLNNFEPVLPNIVYKLDVDEISWKSLPNVVGYGSRNKIKKLMHIR